MTVTIVIAIRGKVILFGCDWTNGQFTEHEVCVVKIKMVSVNIIYYILWILSVVCLALVIASVSSSY